MVERKTKYEKVMITMSENENKSLMQYENRCPEQNRESYDSIL